MNATQIDRPRIVAAALATPVPFRKVSVRVEEAMTATEALLTPADVARVEAMLASGAYILRAWDVDADAEGFAATYDVRVDSWRPEPRSLGGTIRMTRRCWQSDHEACRGSWTAYPDDSGPCVCACHEVKP